MADLALETEKLSAFVFSESYLKKIFNKFLLTDIISFANTIKVSESPPIC